MAEAPRKIIWAQTREQHREGKRILPAAACSNIHLFDDKAEKAVEVLILRGHPKSEACAAFYQKMGAVVRGFDDPGPSPAPREESRASLLVDKDEEARQLGAQLQAAEKHIAQLTAAKNKDK